MASPTTISGIASGIDWQKTVDLLMQIESQPMQRLVERQDEYERKQSAWSSIQTNLETFQSRSKAIDTRDELLKKSATSSDTSVLSVSATSNAVSGNHTIVVNQLAQAEVEVHSGFADLNSTPVHNGPGSGTFTYQLGSGSNVAVTVPAGTTLTGLVQLINSDTNNPGVIASTIDDGGGSNPVHLVLTSKETGASNTITIVSETLDNGDFSSGQWTNTQAAQDSEIRVDGYPPSSWITRESNVIDDVLEGVTLTLKDTDATGVQITIADDLSSIKQSIKDWVKAYNDVMTEIRTDTRYDTENEIQGILAGDSQIENLRTKLTEIVINEIPGLPSDATFSNLSAIGITTGAGGQLTVDDSDLQEALEENIDDVADLFVLTSSSTSPSLEYFARTENTKGGSYAVVASYTAAGKLDPSGTNTIDGKAATVENDYYLVGADGTSVEGLRIRFINPGGGPSSVSGTIRLGTGAGVMADNLVEQVTDSIDGMITTVKDGYQDQIDALDKQIEAYEERLSVKRDSLTRKFLAMEQAVSAAQNQSQWLGAVG